MRALAGGACTVRASGACAAGYLVTQASGSSASLSIDFGS